MNNLIDKKDEYFSSLGDYDEIYNKRLTIIEEVIVDGMVSSIKKLKPNTIFTFDKYLKEFSVKTIKEKLQFTYIALQKLKDNVILPEVNYKNLIALPFNMPFLRIEQTKK